jgi:hypothetical protein
MQWLLLVSAERALFSSLSRTRLEIACGRQHGHRNHRNPNPLDQPPNRYGNNTQRPLSKRGVACYGRWQQQSPRPYGLSFRLDVVARSPTVSRTALRGGGFSRGTGISKGWVSPQVGDVHMKLTVRTTTAWPLGSGSHGLRALKRQTSQGTRQTHTPKPEAAVH